MVWSQEPTQSCKPSRRNKEQVPVVFGKPVRLNRGTPQEAYEYAIKPLKLGSKQSQGQAIKRPIPSSQFDRGKGQTKPVAAIKVLQCLEVLCDGGRRSVLLLVNPCDFVCLPVKVFRFCQGNDSFHQSLPPEDLRTPRNATLGCAWGRRKP